MRARLGVALPLAALAAGLSVPPASAQTVAEIRQTDSPAAVESSYIVMLRDSGTSPAAVAHRHGGAVRAVFSSIPGFSVEMDEDAARQLAADPAVAYVEQDQRVAATSVQVDPPSWGLDRVDERDLPLDGQYSYDTSAPG